jgi:hypothetical protein
VCATWFCKHDRGATGWAFWDSVRELLSTIEGELARACLLELDVDPAVVARTLPGSPFPGMERFPVAAAELDGRKDAATAAAEWGSWAGREVEFYRACASYVGRLGFEEVLALCGREVHLRIKLVRAAWDRLRSSAAPSRARAAPLLIVASGPDTCRVGTYSPHDPLDVPSSLLDALRHFDGRPIDAALAAIAREGGPRLTDGTVRKLVDFGLLET